MKLKLLSGLVALGLLVACGDDSSGGGGSGGSGGSGGDGGAGGDGGTPVTTNGGNGAGGDTPIGDGNDSIEDADPLEEDEDFPGVLFAQGELDPPDVDVDFFSFPGNAGDAVFIGSDAKPATNEFADFYIDLVVTLFDADGNQIAQNDDPFPRRSNDSSFYTVLPSDGTYYLKVEEFCEFAPAGTCPTNYFDDLSDIAFAVFVSPLDPADTSVFPEDAEPNDTEVTATEMEYGFVDEVPTGGDGKPDEPGLYYLSVNYGELTANDTDGITFSPPDDLVIGANTRATAEFLVPPPGSDGNGSSINPGILEVLNVTQGQIVARFDMSDETADTDRATLNFPVNLADDYFITLKTGSSAPGTGEPFYFLIHGNGEGNPLELDELLNNVPATADELEQAEGVDSFFVEGDLPAADVDYFRIPVLDETFGLICGSEREGSGARGFKATVYGSDGVTQIATKTENATPTGVLRLTELDPGANTELVIKVEKGSQDPEVTSNFYRCGFHFNPPAE